MNNERTANNVLLNKQIVRVEYLTDKEAIELGWKSKGISFQLNDGTWIIAQSDNNKSNAGALHWSNEANKVQGVLSSIDLNQCVCCGKKEGNNEI